MIDPLELTVMANAMAMIADEMGAVLVRGSLSPNIRERKDASSALFDTKGRMIAQAAHIPVHLGAMPEAVRAVIARKPRAGDVFILNDPYRGGSHLPDLTLVEAIAVGGRVGGFAAVRAHHADVGGMTPGSMPSGARELVQEGLILPPVRLVKRGKLDQEIMDLILANVRTPAEREGDLRAQLAACAAGSEGWRRLREREGAARVDAAGRALLGYTAKLVRARLTEFGTRKGVARDALEGDGITDADITIELSLSTSRGRLTLDFSGTSAAVPGNVNCPLAVTRAAAVFVIRTLLPDDVPTNDGLAAGLTIIAPRGSAINAQWPSAVAAGNVEMSQRITDTIFLALANAGIPAPAQGQGTMNNVIFGGSSAVILADAGIHVDGWTFYETLGGGQGASDRGAGPSGVHVGMSNTLNTPIESLEAAYPLRIDSYSLRDRSGGAGEHLGGRGVVREYRALVPCTVTLLTERRRHAPQGAAGGQPGAVGRNLLNGKPMPAKCRIDLAPGDVITIETPGGGGWG